MRIPEASASTITRSIGAIAPRPPRRSKPCDETTSSPSAVAALTSPAMTCGHWDGYNVTSKSLESLRSFLPVSPQSHFPIQNLPYGVVRRRDADEPVIGVAIGEFVLDLAVLENNSLLDVTGGGEKVFDKPSLNFFMSLGRGAWRGTRATITKLLREDEPTLRDNARLRDRALVPISDVE